MLSEYILIVALLAVASSAAMSLFGDNLRTRLGGSATALAGRDARAKGRPARAAEVGPRTLKNFADDLSSDSTPVKTPSAAMSSSGRRGE